MARCCGDGCCSGVAVVAVGLPMMSGSGLCVDPAGDAPNVTSLACDDQSRTLYEDVFTKNPLTWSNTLPNLVGAVNQVISGAFGKRRCVRNGCGNGQRMASEDKTRMETIRLLLM